MEDISSRIITLTRAGVLCIALTTAFLGHLIFIDPRQASMFLDEYGRRLHRDISFDGVKYFLADGDIVIFPSYLHHYVSPYYGDSDRITVAANFWGKHRNA